MVDVKHTVRASRGHSETHIAAVCESMTESPEALISHRLEELDISTATLKHNLTKDSYLYAYKMKLTPQQTRPCTAKKMY